MTRYPLGWTASLVWLLSAAAQAAPAPVPDVAEPGPQGGVPRDFPTAGTPQPSSAGRDPDLDEEIDEAVDDALSEPAVTTVPSPSAARPSVRGSAPQQGSSTVPRGASTGAFALPAASRNDPYGPRASDVPRLTLEQVVRFSMQNPLVEAAEQDIVAMRAQLLKARFAWVPIIDTVTTLSPGVHIECDDLTLQQTGTTEALDFQWCRPGGDPDRDINTVKGYFEQLGRAGVRFQFRADILIPITTFGKIKFAKDAAKAGVAIKELQKVQVQQETLLRVRQAWTTLLLARSSMIILREAKAIADDAQQRVEGDLGGGDDDWDEDADEDVDLARDPDDLYRVQLAQYDVEELMRQALKAEALALSALWALAGEAAPRGFDIEQDELSAWGVDGGLQDLAAYKEVALRNRPEAKMAAAAVRARRAQERMARAAFLPDLGVVMGIDIARSNAADQDMQALYYQDFFNYSRISAALALRWRWDFHTKAFDLQAAHAVHRQAEHQEAAAKLLLGRDVEEAHAAVIEALHLMETRRAAAEAAWKLVVSGQQKDTVGGGDARELLRALESWYRRRFSALEAIQNYNEALARLSRATGQPLLPEDASEASDRLPAE